MHATDQETISGMIDLSESQTFVVQILSDGTIAVIPEGGERPETWKLWIVAATATVAGVGIALLVYFRKIKKTTGKTE